MTMTSSETTRRVRVTYEPLPGAKPWRAVIRQHIEGERHGGETAVGRFDDQPTAVRTACTALRFLAAGIPWTVTE